MNEIKTLINLLIDLNVGNNSKVVNQRRNGVGYVNKSNGNKTYDVKLIPETEPFLFNVETNNGLFIQPEIGTDENYYVEGNQVAVISTLSGTQFILPIMFSGPIENMEFSANKITFNGGTKEEWIKLSKIYQAINNLETIMNTHVHINITVGVGTTGTISPVNIIAPITVKSDLENKFIIQNL